MRTHLLHAVHIPAVAEPDTGVAANDGEYVRPNVVALIEPAATGRCTPSDTRLLSPDDEYALGGYAGI